MGFRAEVAVVWGWLARGRTGLTEETFSEAACAGGVSGKRFGRVESTGEISEFELKSTGSARVIPGRGDSAKQPQDFQPNHDSAVVDFRRQAQGARSAAVDLRVRLEGLRHLHGYALEGARDAGL